MLKEIQITVSVKIDVDNFDEGRLKNLISKQIEKDVSRQLHDLLSAKIEEDQNFNPTGPVVEPSFCITTS